MRRQGITQLEKLKALSLFLSSVIVGSVGVYLTHQIGKSQLEIARINNMTTIINSLSSTNNVSRRMAAISLGLYGQHAVPALIALLDDPEGDVRLAATEALSVIGDPAFPDLKARLDNKRDSINVRAGSLYALGRMRHPQGKALALKVLNDKDEDAVVKKDAIVVLGFVRDASVTGQLGRLLEQSNHEDIVKNTVWALGQLNTREAQTILESYLLRAPTGLRSYTAATLDAMTVGALEE